MMLGSGDGRGAADVIRMRQMQRRQITYAERAVPFHPRSSTGGYDRLAAATPGCSERRQEGPIMSAKQSLGQRWEASRPTKTLTFWSCAACVAATIVVGFTWGGWTTSGTAQAMAKEAAAGARQELATAVCVDRFKTGSDASAQLAALKGFGSSWDRGSFVEKGGWAVMPGPKAAERASKVARLCADQLALAEAPLAAAGTVSAQ